MIELDPRSIALAAVPTRTDRPAMAIAHDAADVRLIVFRIAPGQQVAPHRNASTVLLTALEGSGFILHADGETAVTQGRMTVFEPNELHGMRAGDVPFVVLATITPRPGR